MAALVAATCLLSARTASGLTINGDGHAVLPLPVAPMADMSITKTASPDPAVMEDSDLTYFIRIGNSGPDAAAAVTVTDVIPSGTTFVSFTQTSGPPFTVSVPNVGGTGNVVAMAPIFPCTAATFTLIVHVTARPDAILTNTATVAAATADINPSNNKAQTSTKVKPAAELSVTKSDQPDPVNAGENITYTISAANAGPSDAQNVVISDTVPANTTFVSFTQTSGATFTSTTPPVGGTGTVTAARGTFAVGASATFVLVVKVNATTADGTVITNTVTISSDTCEKNMANNSDTETTTVKAASADLSVTKSDAPDPVTPGGNITYTIVLTSAGPNPAQNVTMTDAIPAQTTFVSFTQTSGSPTFTLTAPAAGGTGSVTASAATFAAGASATFELVVNVNPDTPNNSVISNTASVSSSTSDPNTANNTATETTQVSQFGT